MFQFKEHNQNSLFQKAGYSGIGIYGNKNQINIGLLLRSAAIFGNDFIFTIGEPYRYQKADVTRSHLNIPTINFESFDQLKRSIHPNCELIAIEMAPKAQFLHDFIHPERAMYLLGAEDTGIPEHILKECKHIVKLPGRISLNVGITGSIVLYDRLIQRKEYNHI